MDSFFDTHLALGKLKLKKPIIYSPLAGCSDYPFRYIASRYRPGLMFCEMVKMEPLLLQHPTTLKMLEYHEEMRPIGAQLCGSKLDLAAPAAKIIEDLGFDVVDLNCGCPVDKVTKDGSGSGLLKRPELIGELLTRIVGAVKIPVTVKIRVGWDEQNIVAEQIVKIAEQAGAVAIFVHGRTRQQAYKGPANWDHIAACKKQATTIKVIGNGDIFSAQDALNMFAHTGCDGVLVSRGTMGQPWIVEDIERALQGLPPLPRPMQELKRALLDHLDCSVQFKSERGALIDMRKVCCWYLKNSFGARHLRAEASHVESIPLIRKLIEEFHD